MDKDIFEHPIFKHKMKLPTIEKRLKNGIFTIFALRAESDLERDVVKGVCELIEDFGERAGAICLCAYKCYEAFGCGDALKVATEMIYDLSYKGYYEGVFSDTDNRSVKTKFANLASWIAYTGSHAVYEENFFQKRRMRTINTGKKFEWYNKHVLSHLTVDERISLANMIIVNCVKQPKEMSEEIATLRAYEIVFDEYYPLCGRYKREMSEGRRAEMAKIGAMELA